jgi:hypothetical protein
VFECDPPKKAGKRKGSSSFLKKGIKTFAYQGHHLDGPI